MNCFRISCSRVNAKIANIIIVKEGGTNSVDIMRAAFIEVEFFNLIVNKFSIPLIKQQPHNF